MRAVLTAAENARLAQAGPGTLAGALLRRYWYAVANSQVPARP